MKVNQGPRDDSAIRQVVTMREGKLEQTDYREAPADRVKRVGRLPSNVGLCLWHGDDGLENALDQFTRTGDAQLIVVSSGSVTLTCEQAQSISAGQGCFLTPSMQISAICAAKTSLVVLSLPCESVETLLADPCRVGASEAVRRMTHATQAITFEAAPDMKSVVYQLLKTEDDLQLHALLRLAKTYEVLSLSLEQLCPRRPCHNLSCQDVRCLQHARRILEEQLTEPPSLIELARQVGINDFKLKKGFKVLFETTPYSYLTTQRMIAAAA